MSHFAKITNNDHSDAPRRAAQIQPAACRGDPDTEHLVLRAQLVLATAIGITLLRYSRPAPLATVSEEDLLDPLRDVVDALLAGTKGS